MGEAKRKSQSRAQILAAEPRCIYCTSKAETIEHMPPRAMFIDRQRPGTMEFGACEACNTGTRGADAVAALFARIHPRTTENAQGMRFVANLKSTVELHAPGVIEEITDTNRRKDEWAPHPSGILQRVVRITADGPRFMAHMKVFCAKLATPLNRNAVVQLFC